MSHKQKQLRRDVDYCEEKFPNSGEKLGPQRECHQHRRNPGMSKEDCRNPLGKRLLTSQEKNPGKAPGAFCTRNHSYQAQRREKGCLFLYYTAGKEVPQK